MYPPTQFFLTPTPTAHVHTHASHATVLCCCIALATGAPNQPTTVAGRAPGTRAGWRTGAGDVQTVRSRLQRSAERRRDQGKKKKWSVRQGAQHPTSPAARTPIRLPSPKTARRLQSTGRFERTMVALGNAARCCQIPPANAISILDNDSFNGVDTHLCALVPAWGPPGSPFARPSRAPYPRPRAARRSGRRPRPPSMSLGRFGPQSSCSWSVRESQVLLPSVIAFLASCSSCGLTVCRGALQRHALTLTPPAP